ncbi:MAG: SDR family oxidoreductase [Burkholderiales bacterium]|nr:SDR family oxidoreductase [Burkholderiales bacterium]
MKTYFVTGATGVVGSSLVPRLLADPSARLRLLIRARDSEELASRLETLYAFWDVPRGSTALRSRIEAVAGDTTLPRLGLDETAYRSLAATCTHIVHAAGLVRMNLPLDEARRSAVGSARQVVALARDCPRLVKLDFVSTVGVGGRLQVPIPERWLAEPRGFHNTYEQAKAEAEDYLREATAAYPLPLTVHRPSMVVGDSHTGRIIGFQVFYFLCEFLSGRRTHGLYPAFGAASLDVIGCDIVAEAIAAASNDPATVGRILHLCSGAREAVPIHDLKEQVRRAYSHHGLSVPGDHVLPRRCYGALARLLARVAPRELRKPLATLPIYLDYLADTQAFDDAGFRTWLQGRGMSRPAPSAYLPAVLDHFLAHRYGKPGTTAA